MSYDTTATINITNEKHGSNGKRPYGYDYDKLDELEISRTDMNMLIMNYLVTGKCLVSF